MEKNKSRTKQERNEDEQTLRIEFLQTATTTQNKLSLFLDTATAYLVFI